MNASAARGKKIQIILHDKSYFSNKKNNYPSPRDNVKFTGRECFKVSKVSFSNGLVFSNFGNFVSA
jgi:hypothetical protein